MKIIFQYSLKRWSFLDFKSKQIRVHRMRLDRMENILAKKVFEEPHEKP